MSFLTINKFFIIGAPKCGTTSVWNWLAQHPSIFMTKYKEPHYFNTDMEWRGITSERDYQNLFSEINKNHSIAGESSVWYLFSKTAVSNIERQFSGAKYIVCLRNPVDMAASLHNQLVFSGIEKCLPFLLAWRCRSRDDRMAAVDGYISNDVLLNYQATCLLGDQVERLLNTVERDKVFFIFMDDLKNNPRQTFKNCCNFLNVNSGFVPDFEIKNSAKRRRNPYIQYKVRQLSNIKKKMGIRVGFGALEMLKKINTSSAASMKLPEEIQQDIFSYFEKDIKKLENLTGQNLSSWR